jgi:peptidoglycan-N-acetylglucosamine deacetylase
MSGASEPNSPSKCASWQNNVVNAWGIAASAVVAGAAGIGAYGAWYPRSQLFGPTICTTDVPRKLAITFDDGPNPAVTPKLLELLQRHQAKATFFPVGRFVRACPDLIKETAARGHLIGNHTETHPYLTFCGPQETREELGRCSEAIADVLLEPPRWFRPPFGFRSPWLGETVQQMGMRTVMWTLIPGDWRVKPVEWLAKRMNPIAEHAQASMPSDNKTSATKPGGDVLCLHDGNFRELNGERIHTVKALEYWLPRWRDLGLEFVTIADGAGE